MPAVRVIGADALMEIGVLGEGETMSAPQGALVLRRFQNQIDSWQADRLALSFQARTTFTLLSGTSSVTLGPVGATVTMQEPLWIDGINFVLPGSVPAMESPIDLITSSDYAALAIKGLSSSLPTQAYYQQDGAGPGLGALFFWPTVNQNVTIALYTPQGVDVPATLDTIMTGPPGTQEAFMYQLALRLCTPFGVPVPPLLPKMATDAFATMKRPNVQPGLLSVDATLVGGGRGYNVYTDQG